MPGSATLARSSAALLLLSASAVCAADAKPVARVGACSVSADDLSARLAKLPDFQRAALGATPEALKRRVLEGELISELLFQQEAERLKIAARPEFQSRQRELLREAMERELRAQLKTPNAEQIQAYFDENRSRFETPRRVRLWRILVDDEALARRIIVESRGNDGIQRWSQFARDASLDKATHLRNGDLGFVRPDGNTDAPTLRVDPVLFAAADKLSDGELAPEPIKEGQHWAVLWRRGSQKALSRTLAQEQASIRQVLERAELMQARAALLADLRSKYLSALNEAPLETFSYTDEGLPTRRPAPRPAHPALAGSSVPRASERGER